MRTVPLASETDFEAWRGAARSLALHGVPPEEVAWVVKGADHDITFWRAMPPPPVDAFFSVPRAFLALAETVVLHRDPERFSLLYRFLWRMRGEPNLLELAIDPLVSIVEAMARAVRRDQHKMKAFVRFRAVGAEAGERHVAWFEPTHHIVEATAPFFARRFGSMAWSILTPDRTAHWDGDELAFGPGVTRNQAPREDQLEDLWRSYYAAIFNPARLRVSAMAAEMPKKYWRNLPEARLIRGLIASAQQATAEMIDAAPTEPHRPVQRRVAQSDGTSSVADLFQATLSDIRDEARRCTACPLYRNATQTVFGEGPQSARIMIVGEQPGDKEDLQGRPFVGPAGRLLDTALADAGLERKKLYVTNAVKHFKFEPRGKVRLHKTPTTTEVKACHRWYEAELAAVEPEVVVAMGATAVRAVFGRTMPIGANRGRPIELDARTRGFITVHPSYLLRVDEVDKDREYRKFVSDLRKVAAL